MAEPESPGAIAPDAYQAKFMDRGALYHDKMRAPLAYHVLFLLPLLTVLGTTLTGRMPFVVPLASTVVLLLVWALFSVLRISVSRDRVYVQYGLFGPKIPVASIERCEAIDYDWKQYGGWGIRYGRDGSVAYNMLGDGGRAVRIVYRKGKREKTVVLASRDPERLAAAIHLARAGAIGDATAGEEAKARIAEGAPEAATELATIEQQAAEEEAAVEDREARGHRSRVE